MQSNTFLEALLEVNGLINGIRTELDKKAKMIMNKLTINCSAALLTMFLVGCGTPGGDPSSESSSESSSSSSWSSSESSSSSVSSVAFSIYSDNFANNSELPDAHTCEAKAFGAGIAPEIKWTAGPEGTQSYAIVFKDMTLAETQPDLAYHWMIWNIPTSVTVMPEGLSGETSPPAMQGAKQMSASPSGGAAFFGPCPSWQAACGNGARVTDTYSFTIYALPTANVNPGNTIILAEEYFEANKLEKQELIVTSDASPNACLF